MTVNAFTDSANRLTYTADSSTASFTFNFEIADEDSIEVYVDNVLKSLTTDYSVTFDSGTSGTGSVVFTSAPSASSTILLKRDTSVVRTTDFQTSGSFTASAINAELDRLTQGLQEADDKIQNRVLRVDNFASAPTDFTIPSTRADTFLKFDSNGDVTVTDSFEGSTITTTGNVTVGGDLSVTGSLSLATLSVSGNISGTLTTAAQPNITSLGTLSTLTVDNLTLNNNQIASDTGTIALDDNVTVNGNVTATNLGGTLTTAAQTNITSLGTLTALTVDNIGINGNTVTSDNGTIALDDNTTVNGTLTATNLAGTITTAAQPNITSLGTLTSLQTDNININGNTISTTSGDLTLSNLTSVSIDDINFADNVISTTASNANLDLRPSGTGTVDVGETRITNLADAVGTKDAVSKGFMDATLLNAGVNPSGGAAFQTTIQNGSSTVAVESTDGDVHVTLASSLLYKLEADEIESVNPIRLTGDGNFYSNKNTVDTTASISTTSGYNNVVFGDISIANGVVLTIASNSNLRVI